MRKAEFAGTGEVFRFSLQQYFKSKATYVMLAVMLLGTVGSMLLMSLGMDRGESVGSSAETLYIINESPYDVAWTEKLPEGVSAVVTDRSLEDQLQVLDANNTKDIAVHIAQDEADGSWQVMAYTGKNSAVTQFEAESWASTCAGLLEEARYAALGIGEEQIALALAPAVYDSLTEEEVRDTAEETEETWSPARQIAGSAYAVLVFMLISFSTSFIVRAIAQEKSSKLVELLMVSVRPLALIAGKILAAMVLVLAGAACAILGLAGTRFVLGILGIASFSTEGLGAILQGLDALGVLAIIVSLVLGYVSYSILAGISGASCSTVTESDAAAGTTMVIAMIGYFAGMGTAALKVGTAIRVLCLVPFLSVYIAPARFLMGDIGFPLLLLSWVIQAAAAYVLARAASAVYGALLVHRGERVKLRQILSMMKGGVRA